MLLKEHEIDYLDGRENRPFDDLDEQNQSTVVLARASRGRVTVSYPDPPNGGFLIEPFRTDTSYKFIETSHEYHYPYADGI